MAEFAEPFPKGDRERLLLWWPVVMREATDDWAGNFAFSVWKQSDRPGWKPSLRQFRVMKKMVLELPASRGISGSDLLE